MSEINQSNAVEKESVLSRAPEEHTIEHAVSRLLKEPEPETHELPEEEQLEETQEEVSDDVEPDETEEEAEPESEEEEEVSEVSEGEYEEEAEGEPEVEAEYYSVKVGGEELEVTLEELQSGYQRQSDYTKKTQALADDRLAIQAKQAELEELHTQFLTQATLANELLNRDLKKFETVDWERLKVEDPVGYVQKQLEVQEVRSRQTELQQQAQQVHEHRQKVFAEEQQRALKEEQAKVLQVFPEWKNQDNALKNQQAIIEYARSEGYSDQELSHVSKAKDLLVLDKARKWDELQKSKKGITKKQKPSVRKVVKTKATPNKKTTARKSVSQAKERLKKSGSLKDAAAYMHEMRSNNVIKK